MDLVNGRHEQVVDWRDQSISWRGRGDERGLRGLAFHAGMTVTVNCDRLFFYDQSFAITKTFASPFLKHCHEICIDGDRVYLTSTGFDSILVFNLTNEEFEKGYCYRWDEKAGESSFTEYDPNTGEGPEASDTTHINNIFIDNGDIYFSGLIKRGLMKISREGELSCVADVPVGTHNVRFYNNNLLMNYTDEDVVLEMTMEGKVIERYPIVKYPISTLTHANLPEDFARQGYGRGLCTFEDYIICGSSPATVSVYERGVPEVICSVNLTRDIRNSIHGLEIYPYAERL